MLFVKVSALSFECDRTCGTLEDTVFIVTEEKIGKRVQLIKYDNGLLIYFYCSKASLLLEDNNSCENHPTSRNQTLSRSSKMSNDAHNVSGIEDCDCLRSFEEIAFR